MLLFISTYILLYIYIYTSVMDERNLQLARGLVDSRYMDPAQEALQSHHSTLRALLAQRRCPESGLSDCAIESLLHTLAQMDSNNFPFHIGAGEREGRVVSALVRRRHFYLSHGIGRSGDLVVDQPKAAGSSLLSRMANMFACDVVKLSGASSTRMAFVVPVATGMTLALVLRATAQQRAKEQEEEEKEKKKHVKRVQARRGVRECVPCSDSSGGCREGVLDSEREGRVVEKNDSGHVNQEMVDTSMNVKDNHCHHDTYSENDPSKDASNKGNVDGDYTNDENAAAVSMLPPRYVIWTRIDQKSALKCITAAGLVPYPVELRPAVQLSQTTMKKTKQQRKKQKQPEQQPSKQETSQVCPQNVNSSPRRRNNDINASHDTSLPCAVMDSHVAIANNVQSCMHACALTTSSAAMTECTVHASHAHNSSWLAEGSRPIGTAISAEVEAAKGKATTTTTEAQAEVLVSPQSSSPTMMPSTHPYLLQSDIRDLNDAIDAVGGRAAVVCVLSTTSCFAPRLPDDVRAVARMCARRGIAHVINNAYGLQSAVIMRDINLAQMEGRVDYVVQSTDKNFLVPVGGAVVSTPSAERGRAASALYAGRASAGPSMDVFITALSLGRQGFCKLWRDRYVRLASLMARLRAFAHARKERVVEETMEEDRRHACVCAMHTNHTDSERGSSAFQNSHNDTHYDNNNNHDEYGGSKSCMHSDVAPGEGRMRNDISIAITMHGFDGDPHRAKEMGSRLFRRGVTGPRVIVPDVCRDEQTQQRSSASGVFNKVQAKTTRVAGCAFGSYGTHTNSPVCAMLVLACGLGMTSEDEEGLMRRLDEVWPLDLVV